MLMTNNYTDAIEYRSLLVSADLNTALLAPENQPQAEQLRNSGIQKIMGEKIEQVFTSRFVRNNIGTEIDAFLEGAALYYDEPQDRYYCAFRCTRERDLFTWIVNIFQFIGIDPDLYGQAVQLTRQIRPEYRDKIVLVGHSQGGGLAAYAAIAHHLPAYVFNAPAPHLRLLRRYSEYEIKQAENYITWFYMYGDWVSKINYLFRSKHRIFGKLIRLDTDHEDVKDLHSEYHLFSGLKKYLISN
jgi:hypothetical protein